MKNFFADDDDADAGATAAAAVQTVDYVVKYFAQQEHKAMEEYLQRKQLRESLQGHVKAMDPDLREHRDALIKQVLSDCEESTERRLSEAWKQEQQYGVAFGILRRGSLGADSDSESRPPRQRQPNPLKVQWKSPSGEAAHAKPWGRRDKAGGSLGLSPESPGSLGSSAPAPSSGVVSPPDVTRRPGTAQSAVGGSRVRPATAMSSGRNHGSDSPSHSTSRQNDQRQHQHHLNHHTSGSNNQQGDSPPATSRSPRSPSPEPNTSDRESQRSDPDDKPWRASMSPTKLAKIERRRKRLESARGRLARAHRKLHERNRQTAGSTISVFASMTAAAVSMQMQADTAALAHAASSPAAMLDSPFSAQPKLVPKLENFPTYGPQNTAARALRKHKGRSLNVATSHQFTVSRANVHLRRSAEEEQACKQEELERERQVKERLRDLHSRARQTVGKFAREEAQPTVPEPGLAEATFMKPTKAAVAAARSPSQPPASKATATATTP
jgi:hypothetical protein